MFEKISKAIEDELKEQLRLKFTLYSDQIACTRPNKDDNDTVVGIYLYDVLNIDRLQNHEPYMISENKKEKRAKIVELTYMIYINANTSIQGISMENEMMLLEEIIRIFYNKPVFVIDDVEINFSFEDLLFHDKIYLWQSLDHPYQNAIYLRAAPVMVRSLKEESFIRVKQREIILEVKYSE